MNSYQEAQSIINSGSIFSWAPLSSAIFASFVARLYCGLCYKRLSIMDVFEDVFGNLEPKSGSKADVGMSLKRKAPDQGERETLRVYETVPAQMLNGYGMAAFAKMPPDKVWAELNKPLKSGAKYMTELCSPEDERRGVGINRFLQVLVEYLKYQKSPAIIKQNEFILKTDLFTQLYKEVDCIYVAAIYCLAAKKQYTKHGASSLRTGVSVEEDQFKKTPEKLKEHSIVLYKWLQRPQSRLRMLMSWQSAGGLPYVCGTHLLAHQCFVDFGNTYHDQNSGVGITEESFQNALVKRHEMELSGHSYLKSDDHVFAADFN